MSRFYRYNLGKLKPEQQIAFSIIMFLVGIIFVFNPQNSIFKYIGYLIMFLSLFLLIYSIIQILKQKSYEKKISQSSISQIDNMSGIEFEIFLKTIFRKLGYSAQTTKTTGDFGADLILYKDGNKIIVQAKRYNKHVGVSAIQESYSAMKYYHANESWVVTNNYFTRQAEELAKTNHVKLIDRNKLIDLIIKTK